MILDKLPLYTVSSIRFPWDNHSESRAALVSNGLCAAFSHETWNEIVNLVYAHRYNILYADGVYPDTSKIWDNKYTAYIDTLMNPGDALTAAMFNSVRHNAEALFAIGWGWAFDPDFRGYVGRKDFRGLSSGAADLVYPEYILELVRGIDFLNDVLCGTADIPALAGQYNVAVPFVSNLLSRKSVTMLYDRMSATDTIGGGVALPSAPISSVKTASSENSGWLKSCLARVLGYGMGRARSLFDAYAFPAVAGPMRFDGMFYSAQFAVMDVANALNVSARSKSVSKDVGRGVYLPSAPMVCDGVGKSAHDAAIATPEAKPIRGEERFMSDNIGTMVVREAVGVSAADVISTVHFGTYVKTIPKIFVAVANVPVSDVAVIDTAWTPPQWVDGGLYIRQSQNVVQNENGELVIM